MQLFIKSEEKFTKFHQPVNIVDLVVRQAGDGEGEFNSNFNPYADKCNNNFYASKFEDKKEMIKRMLDDIQWLTCVVTITIKVNVIIKLVDYYLMNFHSTLKKECFLQKMNLYNSLII